jgi:AcrR family transcriptional regulator
VPTETSRDRQREQTRARIAEAAARLFADQGFDRTSIRQVAGAAEVDPALVLHYFSSKQGLFRAVVDTPPAAPPEDVGDPAEQAIAALRSKLEGTTDGAIARLRSLLTQPDAGEYVRQEISERAAALAGSMTGPDAETRAAIMLAMNLGVVIARDLLSVPPLVGADVTVLSMLIRPAHEALARRTGRDR